MKERDLSLADQLAILRTKMANERTLLAYLSLFIALLTSGIAIFKLSFLKEIQILGYVLISSSPLVLGYALLRFRNLDRRIKHFYRSIRPNSPKTP